MLLSKGLETYYTKSFFFFLLDATNLSRLHLVTLAMMA